LGQAQAPTDHGESHPLLLQRPVVATTPDIGWFDPAKMRTRASDTEERPYRRRGRPRRERTTRT
jgi:hypothetical protein